ncbi:MAG: nucleotide exchange factor GrpE [Clostridia bacterium]
MAEEKNKKAEELENEEKESKEVVEESNKIKQELEETTDRLKRIMAEFENYKKRSNKEREALYNSLLADIIASFLPVIDNLEKAVQAKTEDEGYKQGIELVLKQFVDVLTKFGVEEIKTVGETFDPEIHEAVSSIQDETKGEKEIVQEFRKGYKIGTKVIRHAMVVVAN